VIAHRGASGYAFENSPAAFREAVARGVDGVELDVHATADGGIVVHHDPVLTGGRPLDSVTLAEATSTVLPNGEPVPTLAQALELIGDRDVWVEVKALPPVFDARLLGILDAGPHPARYAVHSFDHRITARLGRLRPKLRLGALLVARVVDPVAVLRASGATTLWQDWTMIDQALVDAVHAAGGRIIAWTVNDPAATAVLARMGVDGLCGNFPDRLEVTP
jgi:glycerophosphoryl diester phosphodiesterase